MHLLLGGIWAVSLVDEVMVAKSRYMEIIF
jgi:hypothetical protein